MSYAQNVHDQLPSLRRARDRAVRHLADVGDRHPERLDVESVRGLALILDAIKDPGTLTRSIGLADVTIAALERDVAEQSREPAATPPGTLVDIPVAAEPFRHMPAELHAEAHALRERLVAARDARIVVMQAAAEVDGPITAHDIERCIDMLGADLSLDDTVRSVAFATLMLDARDRDGVAKTAVAVERDVVVESKETGMSNEQLIDAFHTAACDLEYTSEKKDANRHAARAELLRRLERTS